MINKDKKTFHRGDFTKAVLACVALAGVLSMAVIAPNALQLLKIFQKDQKKKYKYYVQRRVEVLISRGYLKFELLDGRKYLSITEEGRQQLRVFDFKTQKNTEWDKKWRVIAFDIKEYNRATRDKLRSELSQLGFLRLQNSVWLTPFECKEYITLLKADLRIGNRVRYMLVEEIENAFDLEKFFSL